MMKSRILASVSTAALLTAAGMGAARADNALFNLDIAIPTVEVATSSAAVIELGQYGLVSKLDAAATGIEFVIPDTGSHDFGGGTDTLLNDTNTASAAAYVNKASHSIDLFVADGTAGLDAATIAVLQVAFSDDTTTIDATTSAIVRISAIDLGEGSSAKVTDNTIEALLAGNTSVSQISGAINPGLAGGELGQSSAAATGAPYELEAGAVALVATSQLFVGMDTPNATASGNRISLQAVADNDTTALVGITLEMSGNTIAADAGANDATGIVDVGDGKVLTFPGSAGVSTLQYAQSAAVGSDVLSASVSSGLIEVGDRGTNTPTGDLDGSTITLERNALAAVSTVNDAYNQVALDKGVDLGGTATAGQQVNTTTGSAASDIAGDLFVHNTQTSLLASGSFASGSAMSVLTQDMTGSAVTAGDGDLSDKLDTGNVFSSFATGNEVTNVIDVDGGASFDGIAGINSTQVTAATNSASGSGMSLSVSAGTLASAGVIGTSSLSADGNTFEVQALGNNQASLLAISGTDIAGAGVLGTPSAIVNRSTPGDAIEADFSVLSAQVLDGANVIGVAGASSQAGTSINMLVVDQNGAAGTSVGDTSISASGNSMSSLAAGNLSTQNGIVIDAGATFTGTLGVINDQTVMNLAQISSIITPGTTSYVAVNVRPQSLTNTAVTVSGNDVSSLAWGNLADAGGNSLSVDGVTVADGDAASALLPSVSIDRTTDTVPISTANGSFVLINDQSVEDLEGANASAVLVGSLFLVTVGSNTSTAFADSAVVIDGNSALAAITLNQATSTGAVTAIDLNASSSLVNVQTFADEDGDGAAGGVSVLIGGTPTFLTATTGTGDFTSSEFAVTDNKVTANARINVASNTLTVDAQTQTITGVAAAAAQQSVVLGSDTDTRGEITLVNDQYFDDLSAHSTVISGAGLTLSIMSATGDLVGVEGEIDGNTISGLAAGNDADNSVVVEVGSFDLSQAGSAGGALNGPVATLASNQRSIDIPDTGAVISSSVAGNPVVLLAIANAGGVVDSHFSGDDNTFAAMSRVNNVTNTMTVKGTSFETPTTSAPLASLLDNTGGDDIVLDQTGFVVASRQENAYSASALGFGPVNLTVGGLTVDGSSASVDGNLIDVQARGNDSVNTLVLDFNTNEAQGFVVNAQSSTAADPVLTAGAAGNGFSLAAGLAGVTSDSSFSISDNDVEVLASSNRTSNTLLSKGNTVTGGSGAAPAVAVNPNLTGDIKVSADLAIVNAQGSETIAGTEADSVNASIAALRR